MVSAVANDHTTRRNRSGAAFLFWPVKSGAAFLFWAVKFESAMTLVLRNSTDVHLI